MAPPALLAGGERVQAIAMTSTARRLPRFAAALTEEQTLIAESARDFATRRLAPGAAERDHSGRYPLEQLGELAELGLLAMKVPTSEGGAGTDNVGYVLAMQAIAEACASTAVVLASSNLTSKILGDHASREQKDRWLRPYAEGKLGPASFALSEPGCGSDASALTTSARADGDQWVLDGSKMWITSGAHAGLHLVFARTDGPAKKGSAPSSSSGAPPASSSARRRTRWASAPRGRSRCPSTAAASPRRTWSVAAGRLPDRLVRPGGRPRRHRGALAWSR